MFYEMQKACMGDVKNHFHDCIPPGGVFLRRLYYCYFGVSALELLANAISEFQQTKASSSLVLKNKRGSY
jgi:hypothetical protein